MKKKVTIISTVVIIGISILGIKINGKFEKNKTIVEDSIYFDSTKIVKQDGVVVEFNKIKDTIK